MKFSGLRVVSVGKLLVPEWSRNIPQEKRLGFVESPVFQLFSHLLLRSYVQYERG